MLPRHDTGPSQSRASDTATLPVAIDIRVAGVCNLRCPFCFGPRHYLRATRFEEIVDLVPRLFGLGTRTIVVTGGEPLMVRRLPELLQVIKSLPMQAVLSTNGTLVQRRHADVLPLLDWIAIPLEGPDEETHEAVRPGKVRSFWSAIESMRLIRQAYPDLRIKLGTVISKLNADVVAQIPAALSKYMDPPDIWKIYQTSYSSYGLDNREILHIPDDEFEEIVTRAVAAANGHRWPTTIHRNSERDGKHLFIEPSGDAMVVLNSQETVIGNFLDDFDQAVAGWAEYVDTDRLADNARVTYSAADR